MESNKFPFHKIENFTNAYCYDVRKVDVVKRNNYFVDDSITIDGDAPKKFIGCSTPSIRDTAIIGFATLPRLVINGIR